MKAAQLACFGLVLAVALALAGCGWGFVYEKHIDGPYYVIAVDTREKLFVAYKLPSGDVIGRIRGNPDAYGFDSAYIVLKMAGSGDYYILDRAKDGPYVDPNVTVTGPLKLNDFQREQKLRNLPSPSVSVP